LAHDVFISHSTKDKPIADAVCAALEVVGIRCWIAPRDVIPGMTWSGSIVRAISDGCVMVLVFSSNSNGSQQVLREVDCAVNEGIVIVPFRIEEVHPSDDMKFYLSTPHWLDAITPPLATHLKQLCKTVEALLPPLRASRSARVGPVPASAAAIAGSGDDSRVRHCESVLVEPSTSHKYWKRALESKRAIVTYAVATAVLLILLLAWVLKPAASPRSIPSEGEAKIVTQKDVGDSGAGPVKAPPNQPTSRSQEGEQGGKSAIAFNVANNSFAGSRAGQTRDDNSLKTKLVWIPPGEFTMGSPKDEKGRYDGEGPVNVTLTKGFWLGQHEATQAEWRRVMKTEPWSERENVKEGDDSPASYLSWDDAINFCKKLTEQERSAGRLPSVWQYTLPTEAQWEYACRAGTGSRFSFGDADSNLPDYAWFIKNSYDTRDKHPHAVGQKEANPWGLYDMHGNVDEWCRDVYVKDLPGGVDPESSAGGPSRVFRGGCWHFDAGNCRSAYRGRIAPNVASCDQGFRVALSPSAE
jgi:formylglycine-generating enzyme required for sulfatase activity